MTYSKPELLETAVALDAICGNDKIDDQYFDDTDRSTVSAYEVDE